MQPRIEAPQGRRNTHVERAACCIQQAVDGVERRYIRDSKAARRAFIVHIEALPYTALCAWGLVALTFFERPAWCSQPAIISSLGGDPCGNPMYPSYPIRYLPIAWSYVFECSLLAVLIVDNLLLSFAQGCDWWRGLVRHRILLLVLVLYTMDLIVSFFTPAWAPRAAPYLRIGFVICYSHAMRGSLVLILRTLPSVLNVFWLGFVYILFFAWLGVIIFPIDTSEGQKYFNGLGTSMWSLLVCLTTANYPDVMMPIYKNHREAFLFFLLFVTLGVFFLVNMLTATVFCIYSQHKEKSKEGVRNLQVECVKMAFMLLAPDGRLTATVLTQLFKELNHYHDSRHISARNADRFFTSLDLDQNGWISEVEFDSIIHVLTRQIHGQPVRPFLERAFPRLVESPAWRCFTQVVKNKWFDFAIDVLLALCLVLAVVQTWPEIQGFAPKLDNDTTRAFLERIVAFVFVIEALLRILAEGFQSYWRSGKNKYDFVLTFANSIAMIQVWMPNAYNNPSLIRVIMAFRALRVLRLFGILPGCTIIVKTFLSTLSDAKAIVLVLFCAMYLFSVVGCQLFGGIINTDPNSKYSKPIAESDFGRAGYFSNNFNDMPSGMVLLFELLVVNNWCVLVDGFTAACGPAARIFFIAFYIFGVVICLNIVVAFILDAFMSEFSSTLERLTSINHTTRELPLAAMDEASIALTLYQRDL